MEHKNNSSIDNNKVNSSARQLQLREDSSCREMGEVQDEKNTGRATISTPTKIDVCSSISSFFPVSFVNDVFTSQPVTAEADITVGGNTSLHSPPSPPPLLSSPHVDKRPLPDEIGVLYSSDSGEVVGTVKPSNTDSTESDDEEDDDDHTIEGSTKKRSILKSPACTAVLAFWMIASLGFLASLFIFYPRRGEGGSNANVNYTFEDSYNKTNATQIEIEEDTSSTVMMENPSPTLSPTALDSGSPSQYSPQQLDSTTLGSGSPSVSPSQYLPPISIALEAVEDTFIMTGEAQKFGKGDALTFGSEAYLRVKGGDEVTMVSIIRFDTTPLIDLGATVMSAKLSLFARADSIFGGQINLASDDCKWDEKKTSWANAPDCILKTGVDTSGLLDGWMGSDLLGWFSGDAVKGKWTETELDWQPKQIPSQLTLIISSDNDDGVTYCSRDNDKNEPSRPPTMTVFLSN
eukprot:scaffold678_cov146-Skeletonema_menzelii.AAC.20